MSRALISVEELTRPWVATRRLGAEARATAVTADSRRVRPGAVFVAVPGFRLDGHDFILAALEAGAAAIVYQDALVAPRIPASVTALPVSDSRRALAELAAAFHEHPSADLTLIGVTGTNGKTTVTLMLEAIARAAGRRTGVIGTLGITVGDERLDSERTTPDAADLQALLATMRERGVEQVSMEVSSHGLALDRVWQCRFDAAVFTNLTLDHLDFHADAEQYYQAKRRLFTQYAALAAPDKQLVGVLNLDDPAGRRLEQEAGCRVVGYSLERCAPVRAVVLASSAEGLDLRVQLPDATPLRLRLRLLGRFNAANALAAATCAWALGYAAEQIRAGLEGLATIPGRFERVDHGQPFTVVVDYAHTPDALENVLRAGRDLEPRRLLCVIGCGGDRDRSKRPEMARLATTLADWTVFTSDNPRSEEPAAILQDMLAGAAGEGFRVVPDRREALHAAVAQCGPGDLLVVAGKGHEAYQLIGDQVLPFDDREVVGEALEALKR